MTLYNNHPRPEQCPTPTKKWWNTREEAEADGEMLQRRHPAKTYRTYICRCGLFHHSTKPWDPHKSKLVEKNPHYQSKST